MRAAVPLLALALAACGATPESRLYLLTPADAAAGAPRASGPRIVVEEATVAPYFDRSQMVTRVDGLRIAYDEFDVWAEPISDVITRKLVDDLGARFGLDRVSTERAGRDFDADYQVGLDVIRFESDGLGAVTVDARWRVYDAGRRCVVATERRVAAKAFAAEGGVDARVDAFSAALSDVSDEIAATVASGAGCIR